MEKLKFLLLALLLSISVGLQAQEPTVVATGDFIRDNCRWKYAILSNNEARIVGGDLYKYTISTPSTVRHNGSITI